MCGRRHSQVFRCRLGGAGASCALQSTNVQPPFCPKARYHILRISLQSLWDPVGEHFKLTDVLDSGSLCIRLRLTNTYLVVSAVTAPAYSKMLLSLCLHSFALAMATSHTLFVCAKTKQSPKEPTPLHKTTSTNLRCGQRMPA